MIPAVPSLVKAALHAHHFAITLCERSQVYCRKDQKDPCCLPRVYFKSQFWYCEAQIVGALGEIFLSHAIVKFLKQN